MSGTPTVLTPTQIGQALLTQLESAGVGNVSTLVTAFFASIQATPTIQNVMAQAGILEVSALLQGPVLEGLVFKAAAGAGLQLLAWIQSQVPTTAPVPVPAS